MPPCGFGGRVVTGLGGDVIIVDDLVSANDAHNVKVHQDRTEWFFRSLLTHLNRPNDGIVIGQRLHIDDPMGTIAQAMRMEAVAIPAIAQEDRTYALGGGRSYRFRTGEVRVLTNGAGLNTVCALMATSVRFLAFNFLITFRTWTFTVLSHIFRS
jgi:hypothetical protein